MKIFFRIILLFLLSLNLYSNENNIDSITLSKIKKLIQKEEAVAYAYKKYILQKGTNPSDLDDLITNNYLPAGFSESNPFNVKMEFDTSTAYKLKSSIPDNIDLKTNVFDYYYSNKYRVYTKAPMSIKNNKIEIILSAKEKFIYDNKDKVTTTVTDAVDEYYLDDNEILHYYGSDGNYKFSVNKDLIVDKDVDIFESDGVTVKEEFKTIVEDVSFAGQTILHQNSLTNTADEYILIDEDTIIKSNLEDTTSDNIALLQFGKQSGGMIVNGDIYTWGNNKNRITGIDFDTYTNSTGSTGNLNPVITTLVKAKAKIYADTNSEKDLSKFHEQNYFSSPFRPKFVDLFTSVFHGTCGITNDGALYCGGVTANNQDYIYSEIQTDGVSNPAEMLYRSTYFNGISSKAVKIFANNQLWLILSTDGSIYRWGTEDTYKNGFSGNAESTYNKVVCTEECTVFAGKSGKCKPNTPTVTKCSTDYKLKEPEKITENVVGVDFTDITYAFGDGYKKIAALSSTNDIYIWGMDSEITKNMSCNEVSGMNLCQATKISTTTSNLSEDLTFQSIKGGVRAFVALGTDGKYYKIEQPTESKIQVTEISVPTDILSLDLTSDGTAVYVSANNQLISTHFNTSTYDDTFRTTINSMSWKTIKVLDDTNNSMCALNTDDQLYCWGMQSYYDSSNAEANTFMLPVFNTNLYDSNKDYLVAEGGISESLTTITSGSWTTSSKTFFIKYPTYIGGFNYEFIFK